MPLIHSAPKDGTTVLGWFPARRMWAPIQWSGWGGGVWDDAKSGRHCSEDPTHWESMPAAPPDNPGELTLTAAEFSLLKSAFLHCGGGIIKLPDGGMGPKITQLRDMITARTGIGFEEYT